MNTEVAAVAAGVAMLMAACSGNSHAQIDPSVPASPLAGGGHALVLRTMTTGGVAGLGAPGSIPDFSLYGDGRVIVRGRPMMEYHLTPVAFRRLVTAVSDAGLATPRTADDPRVADALYTVITFVAGGRPRTSKIIQGGGDRTRGFLERLDPATWPRGDLAGDPRPYRPSMLAVLATPADGTGRPWPFPPLRSGVQVGTQSCTVLTGRNLARAQRLTDTTTWRDRGQTFRVTFRSLLPDETGCAALTR